MEPNKLILKRFSELQEKANEIENNPIRIDGSNKRYLNRELFEEWATSALNLLLLAFPDSQTHHNNFYARYQSTSDEDDFRACRGIFQAAKKDYEGGYLLNSKPAAKPLEIIEMVCNRFHSVVRQLRSRHDTRTTLDVKDEYDVQDLIHVLLRLFFNDIRPEEWTPSYAGKSARMDFLLKNEAIVIETKKTRPVLDAKKVGEELIIDIARYQSHPFCKTLICFVYDPEGYIANPKGVENDLSREENDFQVKVFLTPD